MKINMKKILAIISLMLPIPIVALMLNVLALFWGIELNNDTRIGFLIATIVVGVILSVPLFVFIIDSLLDGDFDK